MAAQTTPVSFRIVVRAWARVVALTRSIAASFVALIGLGSIVDGVEGLSETGRTDAAFDVTKIVLGAAAIPAGLLVAFSSLVIAFARRARIELADDLLIHHRGIFRKPVRIDPKDLAAVTFDIRPARLRRFRDHPRFELAGVEAGWPEHLYSKVSGSPFPILSQVGDVPNMAITFLQPLHLRPARRAIKIFPAKSSLHPPLHGRRSRGLLIRLARPEDALTAFTARGWVRSPTWDDLEPLRPTASDERKVRILSRVDDGAIVAVMSAAALVTLLSETRFEGTPLGPATGVCDQAAQELDEDPPPELSIEAPALLDSFMPNEVEAEGFFLLGGGRFEPTEGDDFTSLVADHDPERAYSARWASGDEDLYVEIYEMADRGSANALSGDLIAEICVDANETFDVGVDGTIGMRWQAADGIVDHVILEHGGYVAWVAVIERGGGNSVATAVDATRLIADKIVAQS